NMSAQMMPFGKSDPLEITLEYKLKDQSDWENETTTEINPSGYVAGFEVDPWDDSRDFDYRVVYRMKNNRGDEQQYVYGGTIRKNPVGKDEIIVAAFTGNNNTSWQSNTFDRKSIFFPHEDLTARVAMHEPDFLFYSGDQLYEGSPSPPDRSGGESSMLDYLYKWYLWCWAHRDLTRNTPSVSIPDDHDVFHGNLWGDGGSIPQQEPQGGDYPAHYRGGLESHWIQDLGGYRMGAEFVNMVERTQTSHLPKPYDPTPVKNNIGVYYTSILYGGIDFAVLEDRKFKSAPAVILPRDKIVNGFSQLDHYDGTRADRPEAVLLGERQLKFISDWAADWKDTFMKVALSQTIFANVSTYPDSFKTDAGTPRLLPLPRGVIPKDYSLARDMDSNGWPQSGRNRALKELRKGFAFMIAGDQHLGSVVHHGVENWEDAGISFCVPSVANVWPRRWFPPRPGQNHDPEKPAYTGRYLDGFGNRITVHAVSNPYKSGLYPEELHDRAPGYGIVRLNKKDQAITVECWPRHVDPVPQDGQQYPGWPIKFHMEDNYAREASLNLPTLDIKNLENPPVIQVIDEGSGEIIYTLRVGSHLYTPSVFRYGLYTLRVGEPGTLKIRELNGIRPLSTNKPDTLDISF
ncbi:MAG: alkaline phosphatase D family protein, partial [Cyclobacteriaceae bacterium]|nr:alkaline phosphatase D family protein [Cyclobacteriaceae bacterium]